MQNYKVNPLGKLVGIWEAITAAVCLALLLNQTWQNRLPTTSGLKFYISFELLFLIIFLVLLTIAGIMLIFGKTKGIGFSRWLQILQVPYVITPYFCYVLYSFLNVAAGWAGGDRINFQLNTISTELLIKFGGDKFKIVGINFIPLILLLFLASALSKPASESSTIQKPL